MTLTSRSVHAQVIAYDETFEYDGANVVRLPKPKVCVPKPKVRVPGEGGAVAPTPNIAAAKRYHEAHVQQLRLEISQLQQLLDSSKDGPPGMQAVGAAPGMQAVGAALPQAPVSSLPVGTAPAVAALAPRPTGTLLSLVPAPRPALAAGAALRLLDPPLTSMQGSSVPTNLAWKGLLAAAGLG